MLEVFVLGIVLLTPVLILELRIAYVSMRIAREQWKRDHE